METAEIVIRHRRTEVVLYRTTTAPDIDNSAISILDGLGRSWQQYAARRIGGWNIGKRSHK